MSLGPWSWNRSTYLKIKNASLVIGFDRSTEASLAQEVGELGSGTSRDESLELPPPILSVDESIFEHL